MLDFLQHVRTPQWKEGWSWRVHPCTSLSKKGNGKDGKKGRQGFIHFCKSAARTENLNFASLPAKFWLSPDSHGSPLALTSPPPRDTLLKVYTVTVGVSFSKDFPPELSFSGPPKCRHCVKEQPKYDNSWPFYIKYVSVETAPRSNSKEDNRP